MAFAVVERSKQELMYGLSAGTTKSGRCREVAVVERWPLVEARLYPIRDMNETLLSCYDVFGLPSSLSIKMPEKETKIEPTAVGHSAAWSLVQHAIYFL